ncbi:MAG TPA: 3-phosphoshikimate 1-carboxyvinyltransferase [Methanoregulaceae archaeon]|nr:MAG: 3-phosphoshikimate 1-carboxyvinyltransferase [Methanolinea sp.]HON80849.1 3-phosphoshikimate 1-carboxyvinyltransferase [Methanoregulaceae archaeon]HPD09584.1 3-phosphoshikimate 1-carboxyvinyltransferase [Methanoregulaceae archaeon]HRT15255.1 3-phosphoshikimate 1-carboxyvinyltransferase [Methanoregulaceae archaeon]HRU30826.1 3-phosphoshikimate 1-carboxyvinyltransferase [Methanoregulaceae archaeon]
MDVTLGKAEGIDIRVSAPASKSYTHRALITAALADGRSVIEQPLDAADTAITVNGLTRLGIRIDGNRERLVVHGCGGALGCRENTELWMGDSGTSCRLLTSVALLCGNPVIISGSPRLHERPIGGLVEPLNSMGGRIRYLGSPGFPPLLIEGELAGGVVSVENSVSSQYASSLLLAAPCARSPVELKLPPGGVSLAYLDVTVDVMASFGVHVQRRGYERFKVVPAPYRARKYRVEGDYSSASYFFAIAAACGGRVRVDNLIPESVQGDRGLLEALIEMGCTVSSRGSTITLESGGRLQGIERDMSASPDIVQTLCMVAATAESPSRFTGISHLEFKESDRIRAILHVIKTLGGEAYCEQGAITIRPVPLHGGVIAAGNDHRTAMSAAVLGLAVGGVTITGAECVSKSFPDFWKILHEVRLA